ncbi:MAG: glucuronate isomerase [Spirochaetia bacterium]|jgi:glucuronate isomerase|nr:glucuronate isomerase [Spirochaetia bacterium]
MAAKKIQSNSRAASKAAQKPGLGKKPVKDSAAPKKAAVSQKPKKTAVKGAARGAAFLHEDFLLSSKLARELFHSYAEKMPIIDYHCHLPPREVAENKNFKNLTDIWLTGDHYKWRLMRACGIDEKYITGGASDEEKFQAWARTVPKTVGNPIFPWTHLELKRYFGIENTVLCARSADAIWKKANGLLARPDFRPRAIMEKFKVRLVCTTDDPADDLGWHRAVAADPSMKTKMLPAFRPDKAMAVQDAAAYNAYLDTLGRAAGTEIKTYRDLIEVLDKRHAYFHENGGRLTDHAILVPAAAFAPDSQLETVFQKIRGGQNPGPEEARQIRTGVLLEIARMNSRRGWTMQLHIAALRDNNSRMFQALGPNTGYDAIHDAPIAAPLAKFFDRLEASGELPRTILYSLNGNDNAALAALAGCFQGGGVPGKMQLGSAWWYNDQKDGMEAQIKTLANIGLLSLFVGMLTDSRSYMSYPRHEYFRRILCTVIAAWVDAGEVPADRELLGTMVEDICYNNAKNYFGMLKE